MNQNGVQDKVKKLQQCTTQKLAVKDAESVPTDDDTHVSERQTSDSESEVASKTWPSSDTERVEPPIDSNDEHIKENCPRKA